MSQPVTSLGDTIRDERESRRWTQAQLAERAGISTWLVNRVENGHQPGGLTIAALAEALELDRAELKQLREAS